MKVLFALPGFHRHDRGAEIAMLAVASGLSERGATVTVAGSGPPRAASNYSYLEIPTLGRERFERFPSVPFFRDETAYEDFFFALNLRKRLRSSHNDLSVTCAFPFTNLALRSSKAKHLFVTQNGDWPAFSDRSEYRFFGCDGLVCTNPDFFERNKDRWNCRLIPNGIYPSAIDQASSDRAGLGLPEGVPIVLMVSALIDSKRVAEGVRAVAELRSAFLVVAGDGPLRNEVDALANELLPNRYLRLTLAAAQMPSLYKSANVFLHLSKQESFGNVYIEAMASGLPIVAHDGARTRWIVGDDEHLTDTEIPAEVVRSLREALQRGERGVERRKQRSHTFAWQNIVERYWQFAREVISVEAAPARPEIT